MIGPDLTHQDFAVETNQGTGSVRRTARRAGQKETGRKKIDRTAEGFMSVFLAGALRPSRSAAILAHMLRRQDNREARWKQPPSEFFM